MKIIRKISLLLAAAMVGGALCGCQSKPIASDAKLLNIGGQDVTTEEYRYVYLSLKKQYDQGDDRYWKNNAGKSDEIKENTLNYLKSSVACDLFLAQNNYAPNDADKASADASISELKSYYGDNWDAVLSTNYLTESLYHAQLERQAAMQRYLYDYNRTHNSEKMDETLAKYARVKHILVQFASGSSSSSSSTVTRTEEEALAIANEAAKQAKAGADFDELVEKYGEDPGMKGNTDGYYFTTGKMVQEFEDASFALQEGEVSEPVKSKFGYHVILRLPMEEEYLRTHFSEIFTDSAFTQDMQKALDAAEESMDVQYLDAYKNVGLDTIK